MTRLATLLVVIALSSAALIAQETEKVKFKSSTPTKGTKFTQARTMVGDLNVDVQSGGQTVMEMKSKKDEKKISEVTVLETGEKGITKIRHSLKKFEDKDITEMMGQVQDQSETDVRTGNSYIVALAEGKLVVTDLEGAGVDAGVVAAFEKDFKHEIARGVLHAPHAGMDRFLGGKELSIGEARELDKDTLHDLMKGPSDSDDMNLAVEKATMTLLRKINYLGRDCAVFKVEAKMVGAPDGGDAGGMRMTMDLSGEVSIGLADCITYKVEMTGPITMDGQQSGPHGDMVMKGAGTMKVNEDLLVTEAKSE